MRPLGHVSLIARVFHVEEGPVFVMGWHACGNLEEALDPTTSLSGPPHPCDVGYGAVLHVKRNEWVQSHVLRTLAS